MKTTEDSSMAIKIVCYSSIVLVFITIMVMNFLPSDKILKIIKIGDNNETFENNIIIEDETTLSQEQAAEHINNKEMKVATVTSRSGNMYSRTNLVQNEEVVVEEEDTTNYISIEEVTISRDMDLTIRTGLSKEDFKIFISTVEQDRTGFFYENSDLIYDLCEKYQINEIFFCGLIAGESGWNIASNHRRTYNYISLMYKGKLKQYSSVEDGLEQAAKALHNNYLTETGCFYNGKTLYGVKTKFCPNSSTWVNLIYTCMSQMLQ